MAISNSEFARIAVQISKRSSTWAHECLCENLPDQEVTDNQVRRYTQSITDCLNLIQELHVDTPKRGGGGG